MLVLTQQSVAAVQTSQATFTPDLRLLQQVLQPKAAVRMTGVAVLAQSDRLLWSYGYHPAAALTAQHQLPVASISKQITAVLVLQAIAQQRLQLDQPVATVLPSHASQLGDITVRQLLNHTSGLGAQPAVQPGRRFSYNNQNYQWLAKLLEAIYAEPFAVQTERLFQRCQMSGSFAPDSHRPVSTAPRLVQGQWLQHGQWQTVDANQFPLENVAAGGMVSHAADLIRWQQCLYQGSVLPQAQLTQLVTPGPERTGHRWGLLYYGLGIQISQQDGLLEYSHGGYLPGYMLTLLYYPQFDVSLVIWQPQSGDGRAVNADLAQQDALRSELRRQLFVRQSQN
jgi:CubicO group peptidase (beta-lactamase class C family)